jgi:hypothetical protein
MDLIGVERGFYMLVSNCKLSKFIFVKVTPEEMLNFVNLLWLVHYEDVISVSSLNKMEKVYKKIAVFVFSENKINWINQRALYIITN